MENLPPLPDMEDILVQRALMKESIEGSINVLCDFTKLSRETILSLSFRAIIEITDNMYVAAIEALKEHNRG